MKKLTVITTVLALTLAACATPVTYEPVVDFKKVDRNVYATDLAECQKYAEQVENDAVAAGILLGVLGAAVGGAVGGHNSMVYGAGAGAATGTAVGLSEHNAKTTEIVDNCLIGRGYKVLGRK